MSLHDQNFCVLVPEHDWILIKLWLYLAVRVAKESQAHIRDY